MPCRNWRDHRSRCAARFARLTPFIRTVPQIHQRHDALIGRQIRSRRTYPARTVEHGHESSRLALIIARLCGALPRQPVPRWSLRPPTGTLGVSVAPSSVVCGASYVDYEVSLSESDWRRFDGKPYVGDGTDFRSGNPHNYTLAPVLPP